jgi:hypothetical protein
MSCGPHIGNEAQLSTMDFTILHKQIDWAFDGHEKIVWSRL